MRLVIDRAKWQCAGHEIGDTELLNEAGQMCCLGFYALAKGLDAETIEGESSPECLGGLAIKVMPELVFRDGDDAISGNPTCLKLITTNDCDYLADPDRESRIATLFKEIGVEVEYTGEYPK